MLKHAPNGGVFHFQERNSGLTQQRTIQTAGSEDTSIGSMELDETAAITVLRSFPLSGSAFTILTITRK